MPGSLRGVFFDLDDTLCDTIGTREARAQRAYELVASGCPGLDRAKFVSRAIEPAGERIVRGVPAVVTELGLAGSEVGRRAIGAWFFDGCIELVRAFEGVAETVDRLRSDYTLGVISNGDGKIQRVKWLRLNLAIELVIISSECGYEKPDPRIFGHALTLAGIEPGAAVFVGDRLDVDVAGAQGAGMRGIWFNHWGGTVDGSTVQPDAVIERFDELPAVLEGLAARS